MNNKINLTIAAALVATAFSASAAVSIIHQYNLGEAGSLVSGAAQDSIGTNHFTSGSGLTATTTSPSPVSGTYVVATEAGATTGADFSGLTGNFAMGIWVNTTDLNQAGIGDSGAGSDFVSIFSTNGGNGGSARIGFLNQGWAATIGGVAWVGDNPANGNTQTAVSGQWTHLAFVQDNGTSTFYIDGVAQAATSAGTVVHGTSAGNIGTGFIGEFDLATVATFANGEGAAAATTLMAVPEPSSTALLGLGGMTLILLRRK